MFCELLNKFLHESYSKMPNPTPAPAVILRALNEETRDLLLTAYKERRATAKSDAEKWALAYELQHFLERLNACIQRGNVAVLLEMAEPLATGHVGRARLPEGFDAPDEGMQMFE